MAGPGWNVNLEQGALVGAVAMAATWVMSRISFNRGLAAFEARTETRFETMQRSLEEHKDTTVQLTKRIDALFTLLSKPQR